MTMIDQVALAIYQKLNGLAPHHTPQSYWNDAAHATLEAMREPTEGMASAVGSHWGPALDDNWKTMIDAALAGK